jgi:ATP-dependent DNA helicase RecQ
LRGLHNGEYRLLYVAPERLLLSGFLEDLKRWNVALFAIDEAHCISEWGHDFRPEYRQINSLRGKFPKIPMMALTATATERVRADIIEQLHLRDPACYVASFNRPNLTYRVSAKSGAYEQITDFIRARKGESGIIYCQARKTAESLASKLNADGVRAAAYHAGMESDERSRSQEAFLRDEVRVVCATIAFGMGINKPNVRFVIHYDLPKNIEGYYQETGRAGRDGLPSECLLLFSAGDRVKYSRFIDEMTNPRERDIARAQLEQIVHYAECASCRRAFLLNYFGEQYDGGARVLSSPDVEKTHNGIESPNFRPSENATKFPPLPQGEGRGEGKARSLPESGVSSTSINCSACDNCLSPRQTFNGTIAAQKFLSCVYRIREKSGFGVGIQHIVEVLCGAETERIRKWEHHTLSTYNIGGEHTRAEWASIGRELVRLGWLHQNANQFNVIEITNEGRAALKARQKITLTRAIAAPEPVGKHRAGEIECDELLFDKLRALRKRLADERSVPPYIIFSDVSLRQIARNYPQDDAAFSRISGVGEKKLREFGAIFIEEVAAHLQSNARQVFADDFSTEPSPPPTRSSLNDTARETIYFFRQGKTVEQITQIRGLKESTIYGHLEDAIRAGEKIEMSRLLDEKARQEIASAFKTHGFGNLTGAVESLGGRYSHGQLRVYRAAAQLSAA